MNVVKDRGIGEVTVEREGARDVLLADPIDQLLTQQGVIFEGYFQILAEVALLETPEVQRIVLTIGADIVDEKVVVGDLVTFLGVVPKACCRWG